MMLRPMHPAHDHALVQRRHRMVGVGRLVSGPGGAWWSRVVVKVAHVEPMLWKESELDVFRSRRVAALSERSHGECDGGLLPMNY